MSEIQQLPKVIFNTEKNDYKSTNLFLGEPGGLLDSINRPYPEIFNIYKKMLSFRWDENEYDYSDCRQEFNSCPKSFYETMIFNLSYQWTADTVASKSIIPILAPFVTNSELWGATLAIGTNEYLHGLTYSEIVRGSFDKPDEVLDEILSVTESYQRLATIANVFGKVYTVSHRYALGEATKEEAYDAIMLFYVALYCLEGVQFISSFNATFAFGESGMFIPIAKAVQRICQDEYEVHQRLDAMVIKIELQSQKGKLWLEKNRDLVRSIIDEVVQSEFTWSDFLFQDGRSVPGVTSEQLKQSVIYHSQPIYEAFGLTTGHSVIRDNPIPFTKEWMNVNAIQAAPQEESGRNSAYLIGNIIPRNSSASYLIDGL